jgi:ribosomal protein S18 acetylase RimI-like enzyme
MNPTPANRIRGRTAHAELAPSTRATFELVPACSANSLRQARELFVEYEQAIGVNLCFQNFQRELADLPGRYAPPEGRLLIALSATGPAGCVALRKIGRGTCEMKRLYVRPAFRGQGLGRKLASAITDEARQMGYTTLRLDTLASMKEANALYRTLGFKNSRAYCYNPCAEAVYLQLKLK